MEVDGCFFIYMSLISWLSLEEQNKAFILHWFLVPLYRWCHLTKKIKVWWLCVRIYLIAIKAKDITDTIRSASYLDLHVDMESQCGWRIKLNHKRNDFQLSCCLSFVSDSMDCLPFILFCLFLLNAKEMIISVYTKEEQGVIWTSSLIFLLFPWLFRSFWEKTADAVMTSHASSWW